MMLVKHLRCVIHRGFNSCTVHVHALDVASLKAWDVVAAASEASTQVMQLCMTCGVRRCTMMLAVCSGLRRLKVTMVTERRREKRAATTTIRIALAAAAAAVAAAAVLLTHLPQHPMPRHWLRPVHFSPLATKPSLPALLKRTWPLQSNHMQPHYFIERFVIFPPFPPFFDMQVEGISRQNQSILGRENAGGRIRRRRQGVEKGGESRFNKRNLAMMMVVVAIAR
jgi:hypothetical protein